MGEDPAKSRARPREWSPHLWQGCDLFAWLRLLRRNRCAIGLRYLHVAAVATGVSAVHTALRYLQEARFGARIARTPIRHDPLFILGHWRSGTTLLHELLVRDDRHAYPTTLCCLEPNHFLLTEGLVKRFLGFMVPDHRPMDNMPAGWDRPQEDEFALCMMGQPSPYLSIAFPNHGPIDTDYFDLDALPRRQREAWKRAFLGFLRRLTVRDPRRLVLKSPPHTCRIPVLLELFPDARFVHIRRNPYVLFPSTIRLWKTLYRTHGLQAPTFAGLDDYVFDTFRHFAERLDATRSLVPANRFHELSYEDLVRDPLGQLEELYRRLELGGFEEARPRVATYLGQQKGYETNRYELTPEQRDEVTRRWGDIIRRWGYSGERGHRKREGQRSAVSGQRTEGQVEGQALLPF
jgi:hypothetical protein